MKQMLFVIAVALCAAANNWSFLDSSDSNVRTEKLLNQTEDIRPVPKGERSTFWMNDQPSHLTYDRAHGGIGPG